MYFDLNISRKGLDLKNARNKLHDLSGLNASSLPPCRKQNWKYTWSEQAFYRRCGQILIVCKSIVKLMKKMVGCSRHTIFNQFGMKVRDFPPNWRWVTPMRRSMMKKVLAKRHTRVMKVPKKNIEIAGEWDNFIGATLLQSI